MKKLLPLFIFLLLAALPGLALTLVTPAANAVLTLGADLTVTATNTTQTDNCTFAYVHQGLTDYNTIGTDINVTDGITFDTTVPDSFGTNTFRVNCTNSSNVIIGDDSLGVSINRFDAGETSEVVVDLLVKIGVAAVSFATLIGLVLLYGRFRKKKILK